MTTTQYLRAFARFWWLVLATVVIAVGSYQVAAANETQTYSASANIIVASNRVIRKDVNSQNVASALAIRRVPTYLSAAAGSGLAEAVDSESGDDKKAAELADQLSASADTNSAVIQVSAVASTPDAARRLAELGAEGMGRLVADVEEKASPGKPLLRARILTSADDEPVEVVQNAVSAAPLLSGAAGLLVGLGLAVVLARTRPRLTDPGVAAELVGAPLLGQLPVSRGQEGRGRNVRTVAIDEARNGLLLLRRHERGISVALVPCAPIARLTASVERLANALTTARATVLLVSADPGHLNGELTTSASSGLLDYLTGTPIKDVVQSSGAYDVIAPGDLGGRSTDLLHSEKLQRLVASAVTRYDVVLVLAPPDGPGRATTMLGARCDATVLLVPERMAVRKLRDCLQKLRSGGASVRGCLLAR